MTPALEAVVVFVSAALVDVVYTSLVRAIHSDSVLLAPTLSATLAYLGAVGIVEVPRHLWTVHLLAAGYFIGTLLTMLVARWRRGRGGP